MHDGSRDDAGFSDTKSGTKVLLGSIVNGMTVDLE